MLNANDGLLVRLLKICKRDLLCKLGGLLLLLSAATVTAASNITELPDEMISAIRSAMQAHPDVMVADSKMLSAKSQVEAGGYRWYPRAEVAVRTGESGDRYSAIGLNQTLWDHGKINADFEATKASELVALSGKNAVMQSVGMAAAIAYLDVARAREQRAVAEENLNEHKKLHFSVLKRSDNGIGSKSDVTLTTSRLQQARAVERQWSGSVSRAEAVYLSVVGSAAVSMHWNLRSVYGNIRINRNDFLATDNTRTLSGAGVGVNAALFGLQLNSYLAWPMQGGAPLSEPASSEHTPRLWVQMSGAF